VPSAQPGPSAEARHASAGTEVWLVRHAETEWSRSGQHTGRTDIPLTDSGRRVAAAMGARLAGHRFGVVLTSPLERARETCTLAGVGAKAQPRDELLEWDYGDYEGLTTPQIRAQRPDWSLWRDGCPGGESGAQVGRRVDTLIGELVGLDCDAVAFAHGHVLRVLAARWIGLEPAAGALLALSTGTLSVLGHERETRVIWGWNEPVRTS
jgi:probable phosphoglycerate mutase